MIPKNIELKHVLLAIEEIRKSQIPLHRDSTKFYLFYNEEYYPPKLVVSIANKFANNKELDPSEFSGGKEANDFLKELGFEIIDYPAGKNVKFWIEKVYVKGRKHKEQGEFALGKALLSPQRDKRGADIYKNMRQVKKGDGVFHLVDNKEIIGISRVAEECNQNFEYLRKWENGTGTDPGYIVKLEDYELLKTPIDRSEILNSRFEENLKTILASGTHVFYNSDLNLREGAYLTAVPEGLIEIMNQVYHEKTGVDLPYLEISNYPSRELLEEAIKHIGANKISKDAVMTRLEEIGKLRKIEFPADWKEKTWEKIKSWANEIVQ